MTPNGHMTNQQFADNDSEFRAACERAGVAPTKRRAGKWRLRRGYVYGYRIDGPQGPIENTTEFLTAAAK